jgi:stage III sporulation protein AB
MYFAPLTVDELIIPYQEASYKPIDEAFKRLSQSLKVRVMSFDEAWMDALKGAGLSIADSDFELCDSIGKALIMPQRDRVCSSLEIINERLKNRLASAEKDIIQKGKMMQKLSIVGGVFLVILIW